MAEHRLYARIDELGNEAEDYLAQIPTDLTHEQMKGNSYYHSLYMKYHECCVLIDVLTRELEI